MEVESIPTDDRDVSKRGVVRNAGLVKHLLAGPFIDTPGTRARASEACSGVARFRVIRPLDRNFGIVFFDYLNGF